MDMVNRFKTYIAMDTKSDPNSDTCPSTSGQLELGALLVDELKDLGLDAYQDQNGYVYGTLEATTTKEVPTIGFIAHLDTAPDLDGKCLNPQIVHYTGGDILLNDQYKLTVEDFPVLDSLFGEDLITTDGTTLLGADDKAGIAIIMDALQTLIHSKAEHGTIQVGFTPDEEIGRGADLFDVEGFNADFAYTIDGGRLGELQYENFNAASADLLIQGKNVHPGTAKNIMVNSQEIAMELHGLLPVEQKPQFTSGYEGFFLLTGIQGTVDQTKMSYILRDHDRVKFEEKKTLLSEAVYYINQKYGKVVTLDIQDSYYNMKEKVQPRGEILALARQSMEELGIEPIVEPIRGGTDGFKLSYMGL